MYALTPEYIFNSKEQAEYYMLHGKARQVNQTEEKFNPDL